MDSKAPIHQSLNLSNRVFTAYLTDLSDADFFARPVEGMNTIAWQVGHLISSERSMIEAVHPGISPALPEGFAEAHGKETTTLDDPAKFHSKDEYLNLFHAQREATLAALEAMSDSDLDKPAPERMARLASNLGEVINMAGLHVLMHVGQFVAVRRLAKKPVAI